MIRVLVLDDDWSTVQGLRRLLEGDGYEVAGFASPGAAVEELRRGRVDAVITDLEMPGLHGVGVVRAARAAHPGIPILVVTAYERSPACQDAVAAGARQIFPKPVDYDALKRALAAFTARPSLPPDGP